MLRPWNIVLRLVRGERGQDLVEYGMLAALITVVAIAAVTTLGKQAHAVLWHVIASNF